ncbi:MAG: hypothetical protein M1821_002923 [Bathelium mastoideum]|nr:MAG: hypothetical protein M1821_002923 [Bathelium mastoideum]
MNRTASTNAKKLLPAIKLPAPLACAGVLEAAPDPELVAEPPEEPVPEAPEGLLDTVAVPLLAPPEGAAGAVELPGAGTAGGMAVADAAPETDETADETADEIAADALETAEEAIEEAAALEPAAAEVALARWEETLAPMLVAAESADEATAEVATVVGVDATALETAEETAEEAAAEDGGSPVAGAGAWGWPSEIWLTTLWAEAAVARRAREAVVKRIVMFCCGLE